jgi:glycosyltransferase involved in cell wall biosynthesis
MILAVATAYNEIKYIKHFVNFYRKQNCEVLILDNYSTDGTYEWLLKNNVKTGRVDTGGTFHLGMLQAALVDRINRIRPEWLVYCGIDLFYYFEGSIEDEIRKAKAKECQIIEVDHLDGYNTGEPFQMPFQNTYFYVKICKNPLQMIARWHPKFRFAGDRIYLSNEAKVHKSTGFVINYGMC